MQQVGEIVLRVFRCLRIRRKVGSLGGILSQYPVRIIETPDHTSREVLA